MRIDGVGQIMRKQDGARGLAATSWGGEFSRRATPKQVMEVEAKGNICGGWRLFNEGLLVLLH
jgi:hypothetical protein